MRVLILVATLVLTAVPARAQQALGEGAEAYPTLLARPLDGPGQEGLAGLWKNCALYFESAKYSDLLVELDKMRQARLDIGLRNLPAVSSTLIHMAHRMAEKSTEDLEAAMSVAKAAQALSPDMPDFYFLVSNHIWTHSKSRVGEYVGQFLYGAKATTAFLPSLHGLVLGWTGIVWVAGFIVMSMLSLFLLVRHLPLLAHSLGHLLPKALSRTQLAVFTTILLFVPFMLDIGLVPMFALWWICFWVHCSRYERMAIVAMALCMYLWPVMHSVFGTSLAFTGSTAETAYECYYQSCDALQRQHLMQAVDEGRDDGTALYALAAVQLRAAPSSADSLDRAKALLGRAQRDLPADSAWRDEVFTALGNAYFIQGMKRCNRAMGSTDSGKDEFTEAQAYYLKAQAANPGAWQALYNRSRALSLLGQSGESRDEMEKARALAPLGVSELDAVSLVSPEEGCAASFNANRELALPGLVLPLRMQNLDGSHVSALSGGRLPLAHDILLGPMQVWFLAVVASAVLALAIALSFAARFLKPPTRCVKCGDTSCVTCRPELLGTGLCNQCVYYKIRASFVDPKESWLREKRIEASVRGRRRLEVFLSFVMPGAGHMLRGKPLRGLLFMGLILCAVGGVFVFPHVFSLAAWPTLTMTQTSVVGAVFWAAVAFITYFLSLLDILSWR